MLYTGNMGFVVCVMKIMGLINLWLVNLLVKFDFQVIVLVVGVSDVIGNVYIVDMFDEVLVGCSLVVGISVCFCMLLWLMFDLCECGLKSVVEVVNILVVLVFGCECVGLINEELQKCYYYVVIVVNLEYSLLNLVMVVQVIVYEVCMVWLVIQENGEQVEYEEMLYLLVDDLECFYGYLE